MAVLARHMVAAARLRPGVAIEELSPAAVELLLQHPWRGNVRELSNAIERVALSVRERVVTDEHLGFLVARPFGRSDRRLELPEDGLGLEELEKRLMLQALARARGNKSRAARLLGLSPPTFYYRLDKHGLGKSEAEE